MSFFGNKLLPYLEGKKGILIIFDEAQYITFDL